MKCKCNHPFSSPDVPPCARMNFILTGYRALLSPREALVSIFYWHNETFNIWSHLFPGIVCLFTVVTVRHHEIITMCLCFMFVSMLSSAAFHSLCSTPFVYKHALTCDNVGMFSTVFVCVGSAVYFFGLVISRTTALWYLLAFLVSNVVSCALFILPTYQHATDVQGDHIIRGNKVAPFCMLFSVSFWLIPTVHGALVNVDLTVTLLRLYAVEYVCWIATFLVWLLQFPQKAFPGKFDRFGNSHNIFHVLVVMVDLLHLHNVYRSTMIYA